MCECASKINKIKRGYAFDREQWSVYRGKGRDKFHNYIITSNIISKIHVSFTLSHSEDICRMKLIKNLSSQPHNFS